MHLSTAPHSHSRSRSRFTVQDLTSLPNVRNVTTPAAAPVSPFRAIVHIDMDAFYAQCEMIRLGIPHSKPLAVRQWYGLVAVNYAARDFGVKRHTSVAEAKLLCPELVLQHVPTWKVDPNATGPSGGPGTGIKTPTWSYNGDAHKHMSQHKVCLDPYRRESRKIFNFLREEIERMSVSLQDGDTGTGTGAEGASPPPPPQALFEKASVDEVFIDLSALVNAKLMKRYPHLREFVHLHGPGEFLPAVGEDEMLDWGEDEKLFVINPEFGREKDDQGRPDGGDRAEQPPRNGVHRPFRPLDWDDVTVHIAHQLAASLRRAVLTQLGYTCSAGVGPNKMIAKLGSGHLKPSGQTVIRPCAVEAFLRPLKFTQIRMLGGKLGDRLVRLLGTDKVGDLIDLSVHELKRRLENAAGGSSAAAAMLAQTGEGDDSDDGGGGGGAESTRRTAASSARQSKIVSSGASTLDQTASWLHDLLHGLDRSPVRVRTAVKSILSAKSFNPPLPGIELARAWIRVFVADVYTRCVDENMIDEHTGWWTRSGRRPRTMTVHLRQGTGRGPYGEDGVNYTSAASNAVGPMRSRSGPIVYPANVKALGPTPARTQLFDNVCRILAEVIAKGGVWPCGYLSVNVTNFAVAGGVSLTEFFGAGDANAGESGGSGAGGRNAVAGLGAAAATSLSGSNGGAPAKSPRSGGVEFNCDGGASIDVVTPAQLMGYVPDAYDRDGGNPSVAAAAGSSPTVVDGVMRIPYRGGSKKGAAKTAGKGKGKAGENKGIMQFFGAGAVTAAGGGSAMQEHSGRTENAEQEDSPGDGSSSDPVAGYSGVSSAGRDSPPPTYSQFFSTGANRSRTTGRGGERSAPPALVRTDNPDGQFQVRERGGDGDGDGDDCGSEETKASTHQDHGCADNGHEHGQDEEELAQCPRCGTALPLSAVAEHADWHFATDLAAQFAAEGAGAAPGSGPEGRTVAAAAAQSPPAPPGPTGPTGPTGPAGPAVPVVPAPADTIIAAPVLVPPVPSPVSTAPTTPTTTATLFPSNRDSVSKSKTKSKSKSKSRSGTNGTKSGTKDSAPATAGEPAPAPGDNGQKKLFFASFGQPPKRRRHGPGHDRAGGSGTDSPGTDSGTSSGSGSSGSSGAGTPVAVPVHGSGSSSSAASSSSGLMGMAERKRKASLGSNFGGRKDGAGSGSGPGSGPGSGDLKQAKLI